MRQPAGWQAIYALEGRRLALWLPAAVGLGIWIYFELPQEPSPLWAGAGAIPIALIATGFARRAGLAILVLCYGLAACGLGFAAAIVEARSIAAPMFSWPVAETVDGRVVAISRSASGAPRVLLDRVLIYGITAERTPERVRISLGETAWEDAPPPGRMIRVYARLLPPGGPVEPGGFDFRRRAFFQGIGAVGYALAPALSLGEASPGSWWDRGAIAVAAARARISEGLRAALPGSEGAFAAAIVVGDRSGIEDADAEALRAANLSHLLAISGLHMAMLTGLIFVAVRLFLAAWAEISLRYPVKKIAAMAALLAGAVYLAFSGATVATQRAFIMVAVAFVAVMLDRPAITLRALALAATLVLLLHPVSLMDVGFQMSFAATTALVAGYEFGWRALPAGRAEQRGWLGWVARKFLIYTAGLIATSVLAGLATAPFAAYHFNRLAPYGLAANLLAVPAMGLWIAPMAVLSGLAAPFGLAELPLAALGTGIGWVLDVSHEVASWPGAHRPVAAAPEAVLPLLALGGLWLALWRGWWRSFGLAALACGLALWWYAPPRPDILVAPGGRLIGVMGPEGRAIDHPRAQSFAAKRWLARDGELVEQLAASERPGLDHGRGWARADLRNGWRLEVVHSRHPALEKLAELCRDKTLLVARHGPQVRGECLYFGAKDLARTGSIAVHIDGDAQRIDTANPAGRERPWSASQ